MGVNPHDILNVILTDHFNGWKPADRPRFYKQVLATDRKAVVMTLVAVSHLKEYLGGEIESLKRLPGNKAQTTAYALALVEEQL